MRQLESRAIIVINRAFWLKQILSGGKASLGNQYDKRKIVNALRNLCRDAWRIKVTLIGKQRQRAGFYRNYLSGLVLNRSSDT